MVDQPGFENQRGAGNHLLTVAEAARALGVKRETIYAYAARGRLRSLADAEGKEHRYPREDVERLLVRKRARSGHAAVAQDALRFGAPVLDSAITELRDDGVFYRGRSSMELALDGCSFEAAAELLWSGALGERSPQWARSPALLDKVAPMKSDSPIQRMIYALSALALTDHSGIGEPADASLLTARRLIPILASCLAPTLETKRMKRAVMERSVAYTALRALGRPRDQSAARLIDCVLVMSADHELNTSTFGARVAASSGADLYHCLIAALATGSGPRHLADPDRFEAFTRTISRPKDARAAIEARIRLGELVPGFGHRLYARGDPRVPPVMALIAREKKSTRELDVVLACIDAMRALGREAPNLDCALAAVSAALCLPRGSASGLFALGRTAGWVAHVLEQRQSSYLLRPRARFVGEPAEAARHAASVTGRS